MGENSQFKRKNIIYKQLRQLELRERALLNKKENIFKLKGKLKEKIPAKLSSALNASFYAGFQLVFGKGTFIVEKSYNKYRLDLEHDLLNYMFDKHHEKKYLRELDKQSFRFKTLNSGAAAIEGGTLGLLGIGLADIPLVIAIILRTLYEIGQNYGYQHDSSQEKAYLLLLLCASLSKGVKQKEYNCLLDDLSYKIDNGLSVDIDLKDTMESASQVLTDTLLTAKFIQGIPIIGITGGLVNHLVVKKTGEFAEIKYKKRFLLRKLN